MFLALLLLTAGCVMRVSSEVLAYQGPAHLEGYCVEKNEHSAYYWLKMAAENSSQLQQRSTGLAERLKANFTQKDIDELERSVQKATRDNRLVVATRPQDIIKRSASSPSLRLAV
jgi:hypothetical protein